MYVEMSAVYILRLWKLFLNASVVWADQLFNPRAFCILPNGRNLIPQIVLHPF